MSTDPKTASKEGSVASSTLRRMRSILVILAPPAVIFLAVWLGRWASSSAAPTWVSVPTLDAADAGSADGAVVADGAAEPLADGPPADTHGAPFDGGPAVEVMPDGAVVVDINRAGEDELRKLPGVGPSRAKAILALRARLGRFKSVDDLARIKGFGRATLRRLRPLVRAS